MPSHFKLKSQSFVSTAIRISAFAMFHLLFIINKFPKISINLNIWHQKWLFFLKGLKLKRCEHEADYKHSAQKSEFLVENLKKPVKKS